MIWYILTIVAALLGSILPGIAGAYAAMMTVGEVGLDGAKKAERRGIAGFVLVYGLSAWGLIEWWVL